MRRTVKSPWRLVPVLLLVGYQGFLFARFVLFRPPGKGGLPAEIPPFTFDAPSHEVAQAAVFALLVAVVALNSIGLGTFRATFRAPDADMLFPTPVPARAVIAWRVALDSLLRLVLPLVFGLFALARGREGWQALARSMPDASGYGQAVQALVVLYLLLTVTFSVWGWGLSLWLYRPTQGRSLGPFFFGLSTTVYAAAPVAWFAWQSSQRGGLEAALRLWHEPVAAVAYFPAKLAAWAAVSSIYGGTPAALAGVLGLAVFLAGGAWLTARNAPYLYEQSALRAYQYTSQLERAKTEGVGFSAVLARAARQRGVRREFGWARRWRALGPAALVWKEAVISARAGFWQAAAVAAVASGLAYASGQLPERGSLVLLALLLVLAPLGCSPATRSVVLPEALARIDLVKPLPLTSWQLLSTDAASRVGLPLVASLAPTAAAMAVRPGEAPLFLSSWVAGNSAAFAFAAGVLPGAIAFPEARDPAQAALRGLASAALSVLGLALLAGPAALLAALRLPVWPGLLAGSALLVAAGLLAAWIAGRMYDTFNPADP